MRLDNCVCPGRHHHNPYKQRFYSTKKFLSVFFQTAALLKPKLRLQLSCFLSFQFCRLQRFLLTRCHPHLKNTVLFIVTSNSYKYHYFNTTTIYKYFSKYITEELSYSPPEITRLQNNNSDASDMSCCRWSTFWHDNHISPMTEDHEYFCSDWPLVYLLLKSAKNVCLILNCVSSLICDLYEIFTYTEGKLTSILFMYTCMYMSNIFPEYVG